MPCVLLSLMRCARCAVCGVRYAMRFRAAGVICFGAGCKRKAPLPCSASRHEQPPCTPAGHRASRTANEKHEGNDGWFIGHATLRTRLAPCQPCGAAHAAQNSWFITLRNVSESRSSRELCVRVVEAGGSEGGVGERHAARCRRGGVAECCGVLRSGVCGVAAGARVRWTSDTARRGLGTAAGGRVRGARSGTSPRRPPRRW